MFSHSYFEERGGGFILIFSKTFSRRSNLICMCSEFGLLWLLIMIQNEVIKKVWISIWYLFQILWMNAIITENLNDPHNKNVSPLFIQVCNEY